MKRRPFPTLFFPVYILSLVQTFPLPLVVKDYFHCHLPLHSLRRAQFPDYFLPRGIRLQWLGVVLPFFLLVWCPLSFFSPLIFFSFTLRPPFPSSPILKLYLYYLQSFFFFFGTWHLLCFSNFQHTPPLAVHPVSRTVKKQLKPPLFLPQVSPPPPFFFLPLLLPPD